MRHMKRITVRCTEEQHQFIVERAGRVPLSRWLLDLAIPPDIQTEVEGSKPRSKDHAQTCAHGTGAGYRCWKCGGLAKIKERKS